MDSVEILLLRELLLDMIATQIVVLFGLELSDLVVEGIYDGSFHHFVATWLLVTFLAVSIEQRRRESHLAMS
jgi:hypothetical protein